MADMYNSQQYHRQQHRNLDDAPSYPPPNQPLLYGGLGAPVHPSSSGSSLEMDTRDDDKHHQQQQQLQQQQQQHDNRPQDSGKLETKPQATFLTKLYALLERPEYQTMIRWDPAGEQIIVERPEQLALHVLPSIYRQSRFASFSRQLNIYGFMRKVNLRNVDPAIDDPDASTWSHPTLNRHSPAEVVANFKRRVPPRLPKQRKRPEAAELPRLDIPNHHSQAPGGIGLPTVPSSMAMAADSMGGLQKARARGFSAPGTYNPAHPMSAVSSMSTPSSATFPSKQWGSSAQMGYSRNALPPLNMPSDTFSSSYSPHHTQQPHSASLMRPISPTDDGGANSFGYGYQPHNPPPTSFPQMRDPVFAYNTSDSSPSTGASHNSWSYLPPVNSSSSGSLSSILNPSAPSHSSYTRPTLSPSSSFPGPFSSVTQHSATSHHPGNSSLSPDSRPNTGYSVGSSMPYDIDTSTTDSSRPLTPISFTHGGRPSSSKSSGPPSAGSLSIRNGRPRRRSDALTSPYPSPYYDGAHGGGGGGSSHDLSLRPVTAPESTVKGGGGGGIQLPSVSVVDPSYNFSTPSAADFAFSPVGVSHQQSHHQQQQHHQNNHHGGDAGPDGWSRALRPSTSTSSISSASLIHTPPIIEDVEEGTNSGGRADSTPSAGSGAMDSSDISRFSVASSTDLFSTGSMNGHHTGEDYDYKTSSGPGSGPGGAVDLTLPSLSSLPSFDKMMMGGFGDGGVDMFIKDVVSPR